VTTPGVFEYFQLATLGCLVGLGIGRATALYARGVRVVVIDRQRTPLQGLSDLVTIAALLVWAYEIVASAGLARHIAAQLLGTVLVDAPAAKMVGALAVLAGLLVYGLALQALAESWRLGIDRTTPGTLVTRGLYAWTRNPIYVALDLQVIGTFLVLGRAIFLVTALLIVGGLHEQMRREERFLAQKYGDAYRTYCADVGRYLNTPWSGHRRITRRRGDR